MWLRIDKFWGPRERGGGSGRLGGEAPIPAREEISGGAGTVGEKAQGRMLGAKRLLCTRSSPPRHIWVVAA